MLEILKSLPWYAWVAIVAIISVATVTIFMLVNRHDERLEMIKQGLDPSKIDDKS